ncbi:MAG TPA: septum formation family protein [Acidimicrobiia bacterium]|nr:septum formation family protein [Acidimicrobiia bacterium]
MRRLLAFASAAIVVLACGQQSVFSLPVGTCFDDQADGEISSVPEVDCSQPHDNEVFALIEYTEADTYPGTDQMSAISDELCRAQFEGYVGLDYESSALAVFPIFPTEESWNDDDDREIICALYNADLSKLTGSMEGAAR